VERLADAIRVDLSRALELREQAKDDKAVYRVHNRLGEPCPECGTPIARVDYEEHTVYYCPNCQTGGRLLSPVRGYSKARQWDQVGFARRKRPRR
jgi:formamidopyrimidine-DNA glycosylase